VSLVAGNNAKFSVSAYGNPIPAYQWQFLAQGGSTWQNLNDSSIYGGSATSSLSISSTADMSGTKVRCVVTNSNGTAVSSSAILSVSIPYAITTLVGRNGSGSTDGPISVATFNGPTGVALDSAGAVYVADARNYTVRKISTSGLVSTIAGVRGTKGSSDGPAATATFDYMNGIAVDTAGNVFVADTVNNTIRRISSGGIVSTIAGLAGSAGSVDGTGSAARFNSPVGIAIDNSGNLYVTDYGNHTIRKISSGGTVTTLAGLAGNRASYDGTGNAASFSRPWGLVLDGSGNLYVADSSNGTIRKVTAAGVVTTFAGAPQVAGSIDGVGTAARFMFPYGISIDAAGNLYVIENSGGVVRKITFAAVVTTIAGNTSSSGFLDGVGGSAKFNSPIGIVADSAGRFYVADSFNNAIRVGSLVAVATIQDQSISQTTTIGQSASLFVLASANGPLSYQWLKDGTTIVGATREILTLSNVQIPNGGSYTVVVSSGAGSVTGNPIQLTVNSAVAPFVATNPVSQTVNAGKNATFTIAATGTEPLSYQWRCQGTG
jgi:sugar lactone lactonase YvrE